MKTGLTICISLVLFATLACRRQKMDIPVPDNSFIQPIFISFNESTFRGISLGDSPPEVKKAEKDRLQLTEEQPGHLFYEYIFPKDSNSRQALEYTEIKYFFRSGKLDIITATWFLNEEAELDTIAALLEKSYNGLFGRSYTDPSGYMVWDATYEPLTGKPIKYDIGLKKVTEAFADPHLVVEFLKY